MKIVYDNKQGAYLVILEHPETITYVNTDDIVKAREYFIENMTYLFNNAVCEQFIEKE